MVFSERTIGNSNIKVVMVFEKSAFAVQCCKICWIQPTETLYLYARRTSQVFLWIMS